jgi:hypothetical protein
MTAAGEEVEGNGRITCKKRILPEVRNLREDEVV